jgi:predicted anti-sigma-YlaC factor YlaD
MLTPVPPTDCMQAREAASLRLDGELSELEDVRLGLHLRDCAACRAYAREIGAITAELRSAALEQPSVAIFAPRRRRSGLRIQSAAVAAVGLVAAVAGTSFAIGRALGTQSERVTVTATGSTDVASLRADSAEQHLLAMVDRRPSPSQSGSAKALPL